MDIQTIKNILAVLSKLSDDCEYSLVIVNKKENVTIELDGASNPENKSFLQTKLANIAAAYTQRLREQLSAELEKPGVASQLHQLLEGVQHGA